MIDKRLEEIRARNETYQTMRTKLSSELKNRTTLYQNGTNIEFLLDLVDALQSRLNSAKGLISTAQEKNHQDMGGWGACPICSASDNPVDADGNPTDAEDADHYYCDHDEDCLVLVLDELEAVLNG